GAMVERENGAERWDAVDEFFGAVDRIDDPLKRAVGSRGRILLADDAVVGEPALDELAHSTLDRLIHLGDERPVGLRLHAEATFEGPRGDPARFVSQLDRRRVIALNVAGRDHHAASYTSTLHPVPARRASARAQGKIRRMPYIMGIDTGGTFTDGVVMDADGRLVTAKAPSTPDDFSEGVMESLRLAGERLSLTTEALLRDTARLALGTTVGTNAMLQRRGARVGLITTQGHRGGIHSLRGAPGVPGPHQAQGLHLPESGKPDPIVPKPFIAEVSERVDCKGRGVVERNEDEARQAIEKLVAKGVEGIAICFLWSFKHAEHERRVKAMVEQLAPNVFVCCSADLIPRWGEYERTVAT